jgi:hypothetical protein
LHLSSSTSQPPARDVSAMATEPSLTHAYRHLYRNLLRAVQYSSPARYIVRDQVRQAFRDPNGTLDPEAYKRTVWFLKAATKETGLEHKIIKNLVRMHHSRNFHLKSWAMTARDQSNPTGKAENFYEHYDMTLAMLNKTMGLCLR